MNSIEEKIVEIIKDVRSDIDPMAENAMIDNEILDSFDIVSIVGMLNDEFDIMINVNDLVPENFNSVAGMVQLVERLQQDI